MVRMSVPEVRKLARSVLRKYGFSESQVCAIAETMVSGERDECKSHGLYRLLGCIATLHAGKVNPIAEPVVYDQAHGIVRVDAHGGFSQLAFEQGLAALHAKASANGIAALAINNCVHFSALWVEIEAITRLGLVALACNPSHAWVAPTGGIGPVFGTNPLAFGWPRQARHPFVFDFATSEIARGEIELHRRACKPIPLGWGVDKQGKPSTDPTEVLEGAMLTFGGHKGSALAAMVELIAGPLIGDLTSAESLDWDAGSKSSPYHGELIIAMDPKRFLGDQAASHLERAELLFAKIEGQGARLPSARRYEARERSELLGMEIDDALMADIMALA